MQVSRGSLTGRGARRGGRAGVRVAVWGCRHGGTTGQRSVGKGGAGQPNSAPYCFAVQLTLYHWGSFCRQCADTGLRPSRMSSGSVKKSQSRLARLHKGEGRNLLGYHFAGYVVHSACFRTSSASPRRPPAINRLVPTACNSIRPPKAWSVEITHIAFLLITILFSGCRLAHCWAPELRLCHATRLSCRRHHRCPKAPNPTHVRSLLVPNVSSHI